MDLRNEALEEAASKAEEYRNGTEIADAIRALKGKG
jgi:protein-arginine kinase activator protein McsA